MPPALDFPTSLPLTGRSGRCTWRSRIGRDVGTRESCAQGESKSRLPHNKEGDHLVFRGPQLTQADSWKLIPLSKSQAL